MKKNGYINNVVIISDSVIFKIITNKYNIKEYYLETRNESQDELTSCYNYITLRNIDRYIEMPVTQPFRDNTLIDRILQEDLNKYDMITSYIYKPNRSIFILDD